MKKIIFIIFIFIICLTLYGFFINTKGFKVTSQNIEIENLENSFDGFKIVQISDFLIKDEKDLDRIESISSSINNLKPDIIVFTGDLIYKENNLNKNNITKLTKILKSMECTLYKYAIYGENDDDTFKTIMDEADFNILDNESSYIFYKDIKPIKITGITNLDNLSESLAIEDNLETTFNLVITHYPDYFDTLKNENIEVVLAGHSLNGLVNIPFWGGIIKTDGAKKYYRSYYEENDSKLYVSGGIGTKNVNFRLFNTPQINLYTLHIA